RSVVLRRVRLRAAPKYRGRRCSRPDGVGWPPASGLGMTTTSSESHSGIEERALMPRSSPRPALRRGTGHLAATGPRRYGSNGSEREYSALNDQLDALEHEI